MIIISSTCKSSMLNVAQTSRTRCLALISRQENETIVVGRRLTLPVSFADRRLSAHFLPASPLVPVVLAFDDGVGQLLNDQLDRANAVVIAGIGRSTRSGSQSVSIRATVVMPSLRASLIAFFSFFGSITTMHSGRRFIVRMPLRLRNILRYSRLNADCIFFE